MKKHILIGTAVGASLLVSGVVADNSLKPALQIDTTKMDVIQWEKPKTDEQWLVDTKNAGLSTRTNEDLDTMIASHDEKLSTLEADAKEWNDCPECKRYEFQKFYDAELKEGRTPEWTVDEKYQEELEQMKYSLQNMQQIVTQLHKERELRDNGLRK